MNKVMVRGRVWICQDCLHLIGVEDLIYHEEYLEDNTHEASCYNYSNNTTCKKEKGCAFRLTVSFKCPVCDYINQLPERFASQEKIERY